MDISDRGLLEIAEHEGIVPAPYIDSVGVWTFGIGHTAAAGGPDPAQLPRAMPEDLDAAVLAAIRQFRLDVPRYADRVRAAIKVPIAQHQFDALVSFDLNTGGIFRARLTAAINAGDPDAARHFMGWLRPPEIRGRRTAEMNLFRTGDFAANGDRIPVWATNGAGRLTKIIRHMGGAELLAAMHAVPAREVDASFLPDLTPALRAAQEVERVSNLITLANTDLQAAMAALKEAA